ncbi:MAG: NAD-dependent epimerase [Deltaproteobacteria bacterium]|nr:MAG: NAD-dependent epimerase [Deltaproteobacteria bacterium]
MNYFKNKKILILGGVGFIGSNLALRLVEDGAEVTLIDSMIPNHGGNLFNISPIRDLCKVNFSDIRDAHSLRYLVQAQDIIFSLAGQVNHLDSMKDPFTDLEINSLSQINLLEVCRKFNPQVKIVYSSTRQIYGRPQYLPVDEKHPILPVDVNGINKVAGENYYSLYAKVYDMDCVSLRLTNTYGPRQYIRGATQGFIGVFLRLALQGQPITIFGDGLQRRDFNYVDDVVEALCLAASTPEVSGGVFNLGHHHSYSLLDFIQLLQKSCDFDYKIEPFPPERAKIDIGDYYSDYSLFKRKTGWAPVVDLEEGLLKTVAYFRDNLAQYL